jgi:hypothetical protein
VIFPIAMSVILKPRVEAPKDARRCRTEAGMNEPAQLPRYIAVRNRRAG